MIEHRPCLNFIAHVTLIIGIVVVSFPLYLAFVASTLSAQEAANAPMTEPII